MDVACKTYNIAILTYDDSMCYFTKGLLLEVVVQNNTLQQS